MQSELIDKLDNEIKKMISSSEVFSDEKDYFINQKRKVEWEKLSELANSIVLIFDCYTHKFVFVSDNIPHLFGIDRNS